MSENRTGYDAGPQLPNYMKKQTKQAGAGSARSGGAVKRTAAAPSGSAKRSGAASSPSAKRSAASTHRKGSASSNQSAQSAGTRRRTVKKKKKSGAAVKALLALALVLVAIIGITMLAGNGEGTATDISGFLSGRKTFSDGVKLIGVDVTGLTAEEATGLVKNAAEKKLKSVAIVVNAGENTYTFDHNAFGMGYDITKTLEDGLAYGKESGVMDVAGNGAGEFDAEYSWSRDAIILSLENIAAAAGVPAVEPYAEPILDWTSEERFNYIAGVEGLTLNIDDTADQIEYALRSRNFTMEIDAVMNAVQPLTTIDEIKAATVLISEYSTSFTARRDDESKQNRKFNIQKAADIINGNVVLPGEEWSFNTVVGPRTYELGWKGANGISGGKEYTTQAGGGICQVSTTLYNALLCGNFEIVDRRAHTIPSDYVDKGLDATVDTSGIDFVWKNNTAHAAYIFAKVALKEGSSSRNIITVFVYGEPLPAGVTYKPRSEIIETTERIDTIYTNDATIAAGYQKEMVLRHDGFVAEAYLDRYVDGVLDKSGSILMYTDKYKGNPAEISIGTGPALAYGTEPDPTWQVYGTAPTVPS